MDKSKLLYAIAGLLITVIGWSWTANFSKLCEIEKNIIDLKIEVSKMQLQIIDREEIKTIVVDELLKHGIK